LVDVAERLKPTVVNITTTQALERPQPGRQGALPGPLGRDRLQEFLKRFFDDGSAEEEDDRGRVGSGFIIHKDGYIVTNNHVVEDAIEIKVSLSNLEEFAAEVVGRDSQTELALLKIEAAQDLPVAPLGDSDELRVGEWVVAIGNPFGLGQTVTAGIASAKGRAIGTGVYDDFIQTDASINPGNSGGPLFNLAGEVVGINTAIVANGQGLSFAIPVNLAKGVLAQLRERGRVVRGFLGLQVQQVTPQIARSFGLEGARGAMVAQVQRGGPGAQAGITAGDLILELNGRTIRDEHELLRLMANLPPGSVAEVKLAQPGWGERLIQVKVGETPDEPPQAPAEVSAGAEWGLTVHELAAQPAGKAGLPRPQALVVTDIAEGSPADVGGLSCGDLLVQVNQQTVTNLSDLEAALGRPGDTDSVLFLIRRGEDMLYIALLPEE
jgi:serine protease Do